MTRISSVRKVFLLTYLLSASLLLAGCGSPATPAIASSAGEASVDLPGETQESTVQAASNLKTAVIASKKTAHASEIAPRYTVRKLVTAGSPPTIPRVLLTAGHAKLCKLQVGAAFPAFSLPLLGGKETAFASLRGKQATVVLFWHADRWMARTALIDMQRDIASKFDAKQVAVVGFAVKQAAGSVQAALNAAKATFPQLLDSDGQAFAAIGTDTLPRLYVLDPAGTVAWFDIEYSEGTRRELWQTLSVLTAAPKQ